MGDMGDYWKDVKQESMERRARNRESSADYLKKHGVEFESKNGGAHLIVKGRDCLIDFWPGTGKYIARNGENGRGLRNMLKLCTNYQPTTN